MKIKYKLILGFSLVALCVAVVGHMSLRRSQNALQRIIGDESSVLADNILDKINRDIAQRIENLRIFSRNLADETLLIRSNREFENMEDVHNYLNAKDEEWRSAAEGEITPFMDNLINNGLSKKIRNEFELKSYYEQKYGFKVFGEIFVTNKYGANIAQTGKTSDYRQDDEEWWQNAKQNVLFISDVIHDESADIYSIEIAMRINDENNNFLGIAKAVLNIEEAIKIIKESDAEFEYAGTIFKLITQYGDTIYSTGTFQIFEKVPETLMSLYREKQLEPSHYFLLKDKDAGINKLYSFAFSKGYKDFNGLEWILVIEHEKNEIFASVFRMRKNLIIIALFIMILAIMMGLYISFSISRPVAKLRKAAIEISKGKLDTKIKIKSKDEIGELAHAFNEMSDQIHKRDLALLKAKDELEIKVEERTADLTTANANLERVNNELKEFAYVVSHDLKAPLRAISSLAEWIKADYADKIDEAGKEHLDLLTTRTARMQKLIDGVLAYSRAGRVKGKAKKVDLNNLIQTIIENLDPPENISISVENELPVLVCEETRIMQVFQNLLSNAIKFMDKPNGLIKIGCEKNNTFWRFSVADNGPGIEKKYHETIFKIFQTVSSKDEYDSTGVGLSVIKKTVELYGGKVWLESKVGKGTTFFFTFPQHIFSNRKPEFLENPVN
ncbi:MAG: HAMP domain-containing protein [Candidatus Aminicenantes bacterium]|nr:HAMP domain-containing protein [Candidatus Aminicenantes bacterium]